MTRAWPTTGGCYAVGYRRVSTAEQGESGLGLEAQMEAIGAAAGRLGLRIAAAFADVGVSGGLPLERRPGLVQALDALRKGDTLIVAKRDRLGRDLINVGMFERLAERKGARIVSAAGEGTDAKDANDPVARLMRQIIDCFAEYERALIRARTRAALAAKRARGERVGAIPLGFQLAGDGASLAPHAVEQRALVLLRALRASGCSMRAVADELNRQGFRTRRGGFWRHQYVSLQLARVLVLSETAATPQSVSAAIIGRETNPKG